MSVGIAWQLSVHVCLSVQLCGDPLDANVFKVLIAVAHERVEVNLVLLKHLRRRTVSAQSREGTHSPAHLIVLAEPELL